MAPCGSIWLNMALIWLEMAPSSPLIPGKLPKATRPLQAGSDTPFPGKGPNDDRQEAAQSTWGLQTEKHHVQPSFRSMPRLQKAYDPNT